MPVMMCSDTGVFSGSGSFLEETINACSHPHRQRPFIRVSDSVRPDPANGFF
jgi:hypothetical protein